MKFRTAIAATMAICLGAAAAIAADEPQAVRQAQMKQIGASVGALGAIAKGEKPYDAETVKKALSTIAADAKDFPNHFPAGSETVATRLQRLPSGRTWMTSRRSL